MRSVNGTLPPNKSENQKNDAASSGFMLCSNCGECCRHTQMLLCRSDIKRIRGLGHSEKEFVHFDRKGFARLKNRNGHCVFYLRKASRCDIYRHRPLGCRIYPVMADANGHTMVDDLCPMVHTVTEQEVKRKSQKLFPLLRSIDSEAVDRRRRLQNAPRSFDTRTANNLK